MKRLALALLLASPAAAQTYDPVLTQAGLQGSPATMTPLNLGDDNTAQVTLSFPFEYYGQTFTTAWVSSNGFVSFQSSDNLCCNGYALSQAQRNTIYGYWTDLIGGSNPYYRMTETDALFGWYSTREYATNNSVTMEINLASSGAIQITYGAVANTYHQVAAGITGPTVDDNIQLFLGSNVSNLSFQAGILTPTPPPEPETPAVNCQTTPDAPECVQTYSPVEITPEVTVAAAEPTQEEVTTIVVETPVEEAAVVQQPAAEEPAVEETVAVSETTEVAMSETAAAPERLSPDEVLALAAAEPQEDATEAVAEPMAEQPTEVSAAAPAPPEAPSAATVEAQAVSDNSAPAATQSDTQAAITAPVETVETSRPEVVSERTQVEEAAAPQRVTPITVADAEQAVTEELHSGAVVAVVEPEMVTVEVAQPQQEDMTSPSSQAVTMELLSNSMPEANTAPEMAQVSNGTSDAMVELAVAPAGYGSYSQARIPDAPFYAPKDIYKNRKVPDAYWELYRMMHSQDTAWNAMVEDQYER